MSLMDFFKGQPAPAMQESSQQSLQESQNNQQLNGSNSQNNQQQSENSGLESFKDLWNNTNTEGEQLEDDSDLSSLFTVDPDKINESVSKIDFTQSISPEALEAISAGGEEAVKAFATSLNKVAQEVFSKSMLASGSLVKQAFSKAQDRIDARASRNFTRLKVSDELTSVNPLLKDPSVAPMVAAVQSQLQRKYPDASADEIRTQAEKYFENFAKLVTKKPESTAPERDITDFSDFF